MKDITPEHHPIALARDFLAEMERNPAKAAFVAWEDENGAMHRRGVAFESKDLLWAAVRVIQDLMGPE